MNTDQIHTNNILYFKPKYATMKFKTTILFILVMCGLFFTPVSADPSISLVSFYPTPLNTNYTGATVISYMVNSSEPLNLSSLAFLYGLNYTTTGDMHNYIATPPIDIASEGIYLGPNRNATPYLSWEFNDTITEGNVWQWGGGDNNSWWIEKNQINATHTYINATGVTQHILPSSFYIQKLAMYNAPKTGFEINRQQGLIFKMWNVEEIRNRGHNYFANLYFDTSWESTLPNYPVEVGFCNYSYDPAVDDIDTCPDCIKFGEWDGNRWVNHSWVPGANASYAYPLVVNGSQYTEPTPTDINYIWLRSNTISSKSYILNATDYDPGITNRSFAETETMWTYNELNGVTSPVAYTPSFFTTFVRNDEELLHHLYIADDTGVWGHSDIFNESIGISSVPVPPVSFEYFNVTCDESYHDYEMDATYDQGTVGVGIYCPADPDGTTVSHNLTLHYFPNQTLVAVINNTFTTTGSEGVEIEFTTTPYYSSDTLYTLKCVSTDGDDNVATKWLISYFALDADGNRGWVKDSMLLFWGMDDIPTLYTEVNNNSLISYEGGSDIYTMHVPFFKSKGNDTFNFNETVHLESLNNEDVAFFRYMGRTNFDNANIAGWNTTTDTAAPITDEYRAYVYSLTMTCGNITNSNFSYLGSDFYRQEGLNFVGNSYPYLIHNSTFSNNAEGPIFEECSNFTISNCTIMDNVNVGIGVYFSDDFIIENNSIGSNGGRGIVMYEANNNIISYNDITNSGIHGVHYWSNSQNNTCTGNDISESALYDYYLSSSSTGNYIIDPASTTDRIRVTSTSSVNIENTDNTAFTEDSLNTTYAYLTNFSMYVSGVSQTFDITQRDMTITPSNDNLSIQNFDWGNTIQFNAESSIGVNQTWINITNTRWKNEQISIFVAELPYNISYADDNGTLDYNYSVSIGDNFFEFILTIPPSPVPVSLYIFMGVLLFVFCGASFILTGIPSIFTSILSIMFSFIMSKIAVNGSLVQNIGGISSTGTVVQGVTIIEIPALSYILIFVGLFMVVILAIQVLREIKFRESRDTIELDL
ncbi:MAG: right-handed parallel beta-helix repeat-containing protein [Thermodesulfovibrionia bacterium]|nr:right-handed parallel beta-helix repeat-containing protein [Thermodesulfovibrionia bacterium]